MKVFNYIIMMTVLILFMKMAGFPIGADAFLNVLQIDVDSIGLVGGSFYVGIVAILVAAAVVGIAIGFITKAKSENYVILGIITSTLVFFTIALTSIISYAITNFPGWVSSVIILIFAPLAVGYLFSLIEFFRGSD